MRSTAATNRGKPAKKGRPLQRVITFVMDVSALDKKVSYAHLSNRRYSCHSGVCSMQSPSFRDPHVIGTLAAPLLCAAGLALYFLVRRRPTAEEVERERRAQLVRGGRIIDGTILDAGLGEDGIEPQQGADFILYQYEIGGVQYECSQDVSALRGRLKAEDLRVGFPCSVRYDVYRPENSIIVAENWSGLRTTALSVPVRRLAASSPAASAPATP